jgi:ABC-type branched-subunit amino acid transport system substrate-binding protein
LQRRGAFFDVIAGKGSPDERHVEFPGKQIFDELAGRFLRIGLGRMKEAITHHIVPCDAMGQWLLKNNRKRWYSIVSEAGFGQEVCHRSRRFLQQQGGADLGCSVITSRQSAYQDVLAHLGGVEAEAVVVALMGEELRHFLEQYRISGLNTLLAGIPLDMSALWQASLESLQGVWVTSWYHGLERFSARELNRRFYRRFEKPAEGFAWTNWAAVKLVMEGVLRSASTEASALVSYLESGPPFDGTRGDR